MILDVNTECTEQRDRSHLPSTIFRASVQLKVAERSELRRTALQEALRSSAHLAVNQVLAAYFQMLDAEGPFKDAEERFCLTVILSDAVLDPSLSNSIAHWVEPDGNVGHDGFSNGMLHFPARRQSCMTPQPHAPKKIKANDYPAGLPCPEGGAIVVKNETLGGGVVQRGKNIMIIYLPLVQLIAEEVEPGMRLRGVVDPEVIEYMISYYLRGNFRLPVPLTDIADKLRARLVAESHLPTGSFAFAVMVAPEELSKAADSPPAAEDTRLSFIDDPAGGVYVGRGQILATLDPQTVGFMTLVAVVCPFRVI